MQKTFKIMLAVVVSAASYTSLFAKDGVCFHCEEIREYNRAHPQKEQYYEDYIKEHPESEKTAPSQESTPQSPQVHQLAY